MSSPDPAGPLASVAGLTAARTADTLDALGLRHQVCHPGLQAVAPGMRLVGNAVTVQFSTHDEAGELVDPYGDMIDAIDRLRRGDVMVIATGGDDRTAYWGQLFSAAARGHGARGVICDGPIRDSADIAAMGFPVFASASRPVDYRARMRVAAVAAPVTCGGVPVAPGDVVVADHDGVVIVPSDVVGEVARLASARATSEDAVLDELLGGASLRAVWDRHHVL